MNTLGDMPLVSVVTVTYNCRDTVLKTMRSVLSQTYVNIEYIIVDGGSTDGTVDIIQEYIDRVTYFVSESDNGIFDAMNKGIAIANGKWINFMNAGDIFINCNVLAEIFRNDYDSVGVIFGDKTLALKDGIYQIFARPFYKVSSIGMGINHQCVFVRTDLIKSTKFDLKFRVAADYNMMYSLYSDGVVFKYVSIPIALVEDGGFSMRNRRRQMQEEEWISVIAHRSILTFYKEYMVRKVKKILMAMLPLWVIRKKHLCNPNIKKIDY